MLRKILAAAYEDFEKYFCAFILAVLVLGLGLQVFFRYVLNASLSWSEELSRFCFIWSIYLGASLAVKKEQHVRVTAQFLLIPKKWRFAVWMFTDIVWAVFNIVFAIEGIGLVRHAFQFPEISPALEWNSAWLYMVIPAGFLLMTLRMIQLYYRSFKNGTWRELVKIGEG
jgi:TRAP-type C4-dicarboxylate transport system permease small subunit